jgi:PPOX class probable F420-dependent enzyme
VIPEGYGHLLERPLFAHLATTRPDGRPQSHPMWFVYRDGLLRFTSRSDRPQSRNLRANPVLSLSILDPDEPYRYLGLEAVLEDIEPDPTGSMWYELAARYGLEGVRLDDPSTRVVLVARPTRFWHQ